MYKFAGKLFGLLLRRYAAKKPISHEEALRVQEELLLGLVKRAAKTKFGIDHGFGDVTTISKFQRNVPVRDYQAFWKEYWSDKFPLLDNTTWPGRIFYFAKTSGTTTGKSKFIPCSKDMVKSNNAGGLQVVIEHLRNRPDSKVLEGRTFLFAGSPDLDELAQGVFAGELSGIAARETPRWAGRDRYYPPENLAVLKDWEEKLEKISVDCLDKDIRAISGLPSWLQILFEKIFANSPERSRNLKCYFPDLELIVHGGMGFKPYHGYFQNIVGDSRVDFREVYAASEGFFAIADRGYDEGLRLIVDNGIFYEFVKADEMGEGSAKRYWLGDIEKDINYAIIVTTCAGLWGYVVGDIIRFTDIENLRILFAGRLSQTLSVFGEKIVNEELEVAVAVAAAKMGLNFHDFAVGSVFLKNTTAKGQHKFIVEFEETLTRQQQLKLAKIIDGELGKSNSGYATRRKNEVNIIAPVVVSVPSGTFAKWMDAKGKMGGQNKVPRVLEQEQLDDLLKLTSGN